MDPARKHLFVAQEDSESPAKRKMNQIASAEQMRLWCRVVLDNLLDFLLVSRTVLFEEVVRLRLCRRIWVGIV